MISEPGYRCIQPGLRDQDSQPSLHETDRLGRLQRPSLPPPLRVYPLRTGRAPPTSVDLPNALCLWGLRAFLVSVATYLRWSYQWVLIISTLRLVDQGVLSSVLYMTNSRSSMKCAVRRCFYLESL